ncbi:MAG: aldo/keto reductase, partial [Polyangiales bacterium]
GQSEEIVGRWLAERPRDQVFVATKVAGPAHGWFVPAVRHGKTALDAHHIERAVEGSLKRLKTDYIDLYQTHWPEPDLPIEVTLEALQRVVKAGKVRYVGASNETAYGLTKALYKAEYEGLARYQTIQNNFSLLNRRFEDELSNVCRREHVSLLPFSPIAGGVLSGKYGRDQWPEGARFTLRKADGARGEQMTKRFLNEKTRAATERFVALARELELPPVTFATAWTLSRDFVGSTIIGATAPAQLDDLLRASDVTLPADVLAKVDAISQEILYPMG